MANGSGMRSRLRSMTASWMAWSRALTSVKVWVKGLKIAPDRLDFIEFGGVFRQPLDGEPMCAGGQGGERAFAGVDRTIVLDQHDRLGLSPGLRSKETVELLQMGDEIAAALGRAGMDDELARDGIERPQHRDLLGLPR